MPVFKEMDPELVWAALEGHKDVLTPEAESLERMYRTCRCPRCKTELQKEFDPNHVFADENVSVPRALLRCTSCRYLLNPHNNMIIEYGDASKTPVESIPIIDPDPD